MRRVAQALARKASALRGLDRVEQAVEVWDELITRQAQEDLTAVSRPMLVALYGKARDLEQLGRYPEALAAVEELRARAQSLPAADVPELLVARAWAVSARVHVALGSVNEAISAFHALVAEAGEAGDAELRQWTAWALEYQSRLLIAEGEVDQGLVLSAALVSRLVDEPAESLVRVVEIINNHSLLLLQLGAPNPGAVARFLVLVLLNTLSQALAGVDARVAPHLPGWVLRSVSPVRLSMAQRVKFVSMARQSRRRVRQARAASHAVIARIGSSEDPALRRGARTAEFILGMSLVVLGHPVAGARAMETFTSKNDLDAIQAFQWVSRRSYRDQSVVSEVGRVASAALRARVLADGDPEIARIAYEDSLTEHAARSAHPTLARLLSRFLRPNVQQT